jgi:uncharacterized protein (DUF1800 family)
VAVPSDADLRAAIAATRFGLGARPVEIAAARADPRGFLKAQIRPSGADQPPGPLPDSGALFSRYVALRQDVRAVRQAAAGPAPPQQAEGQATPPPAAGPQAQAAMAARGRMVRQAVLDEVQARAALDVATPDGFRERWALFWANHFTVSTTKGAAAPIVGAFEREAIRPHVFGRFEDLLVASTRHPAMLIYLDQVRSAGPDSPAGQRRRIGLNETLSREIMELHTLGVGSGYTQADVTEFARALTGWSMDGGQPRARMIHARLDGGGGETGGYLFRASFHQPGDRTVLGRRYGQGGEDQARAILTDLAAAPATARHLAVKLARHFVADDPPQPLVDRLEAAYRRSGGRLDVVAAALVDAPEAWDPAPRKFKTPYEFLVSAYRAIGAPPTDARHFAGVLTLLGQKPYSAPSPKGWEDVAGGWAAPNAVVTRMAWAERFGQAVPQADPPALAQSALGARLTPDTAAAIGRAESRPEAIALLLMSPEFQRR